MLMLLGASKSDILNDYGMTYQNLRKKFDSNVFEIPEEFKHFMYSKPEYLEPILDYILETYKSVNDYFLYMGLTQKEIHLIKEKYTEDAL